jgi:glycosyltransferase involved in cell wall biosynthesis
MRILAIHNFHREGSVSGDDQVFKSETALLQEHGHEIIRYSVRNDAFDQGQLKDKIQNTLGMFWSKKSYQDVCDLIDLHHPDLVHVHTFFPLLSPSVLYAAKSKGVPVVATLHDTRFICPCATSLKNNEICNACGDGHYLRMVRYGCFKDSRLQSAIVAGIFGYHRHRKSFYEQIDRYICLNDNQIALLEQIGFDSNKIVKKYNFVTDTQFAFEQYRPQDLPERYVVFYGRIGEEKGIRLLMAMWEKLPDIPLVVMGSGPLQAEFEAWAKDKANVHYLGYTKRPLCLSIVKQAEFVVFPSIWYEGCSMVEIETESLSKALIATDLGFSAEAIQDGYNGCKIALNDIDGFVSAIRKLWANPNACKQMGENARKDFEAKYLPEENYRQLIQIYEQLLDEAN